MRRKLLRWIAWLTYHLPYSIVFGAALLTAAALVCIARLEVQSDVLELLPESPEVMQYRRALRQFGTFEFNLIVLESAVPDAPLLIDAAEKLAQNLNDRHYLFDINHKIDASARDFFLSEPDKRIVNLFTNSDWDEINKALSPERIRASLLSISNRLRSVAVRISYAQLLDDPLDLSRIVEKRLIHSLGPLKVNLRDGYYLSEDRRMLLMVLRPTNPPSDLLFVRDYMRFLRGTREFLFARNPEFNARLKIHFIGPHAEMQDEAANVRRDIQTALLTSFVLVLLLFIVSFRRFGALLFVGIPLVLAVIWTLGFAALIYGRISTVALIFSAVLFGLSIDFAIHLYNRFAYEYVKDSNLWRALETALLETGEGLITSAVTTAIAFYGMLITSFRGFQELGMIAGSGMLMCLGSMLLVLPALMVIQASFQRTRLVTRRFTTPGLRQLTVMVEAYPRLSLLLGLILTAWLGFHAGNIRFNDDLADLKQPPREYREILRRVEQRFDLPSCHLLAIVRGDTFEEALQKNDLLYEALEEEKQRQGVDLVSYDSLRTLLPSVKSQQQSHRRIAELDFSRLEEQLRAEQTRLGLSSKIWRDFWKRFQTWQNNVKLEEEIRLRWTLGLNPILVENVQNYVYHGSTGYRVVTHLYPRDPAWRGRIPPEFIERINARCGPLIFTGATVMAQELEKQMIRDLAWVVIIVSLGVFLALLLHFRRLPLAVISILPTLCAVIWMLGILELVNLRLNFINIISIPLVIGLGIDDGVHILQRYYEKGGSNINAAIQHTGRAILISSLTTMLSFGALLLADFSGIREMGMICVMGVGFACLSSILLIPAILLVFGPRFELSRIIGADQGVVK